MTADSGRAPRRTSLILGLTLYSLFSAASHLEAVTSTAAQLIDSYLEAWQGFYPTRALDLGIDDAIYRLEDRSQDAIQGWIASNEAALSELEGLLSRSKPSLDDHVDLRLLRAQIRRELATWRDDAEHIGSLAVYATPLTRALPSVLSSPLLSSTERNRLLADRLAAMKSLLAAAREQWEGSRRELDVEALARLRELLQELESREPFGDSKGGGIADERLADLRQQLRDFTQYAQALVEELPSSTPILGPTAYARGLALYLDSAMTPQELEALARAQIEDAKRRIRELSADFWRSTYPQEPIPEDADAVVRRAFADLESRRPLDNSEYLDELRAYGREIERFVRDNEIATLPEHHTLSIEIAPESAGPMARVGYVSSAPPFTPNPWTTWYLATIPDSHPQQERIDFWRSFNYAFKKFIVVHELFPGHYLQQKLLRENLHPVRIFFGWAPFTEGWATFCEEVAFEQGWAEGDHLVRLAQQRKRLENANRAFMSVQAHVNGWSEERVYRTSIDEAWLAPQFAKSLWNRLMNWPFQMTTYMLGGLQLQELYAKEKARLGEGFETKRFMDTLLRLGPIPIEEIPPFLVD